MSTMRWRHDHRTGILAPYAARLTVDYPAKLDRLTTLLRLVWILPIAVILSVVAATGDGARTGGALIGGLWLATMLMLAFRVFYPRWWFDFARELTRFGARVGAYLALLTDRYPSTVDEQSVHLEIDYPDVGRDLNRWLPLVKWLLAIPHYVVLALLWVGVILAVVTAWFAILLTGRYPGRSLTTSSASAAGACGSVPTPSCWSLTAIHRSA